MNASLKNYVSGGALILATTLASFTEMQANAEEPKLDDVTAKQILERMAKAYTDCKSYQDSGVEKTVFVKENGSDTYEVSFTTAFVRPARFRSEYKKQVVAHEFRHIVWSNGKDVRTWWNTQLGLPKPESLDLALAGATGVFGDPVQTIPALLLPDVVGGRSLISITESRRADDGKLEETECFRVEGRFADSPITLWIDKKSYLVRRIDQQRQFGSFRTENTTAYKPKIDEKIDDKLLEFDPPTATEAQSAPEKETRKKGFGTEARKEIVNDPEIKQLRSMLESTYGDLVRELALTPEKEEAFINALLDNQIKRVELTMGMIKKEGMSVDKKLDALAKERALAREHAKATISGEGETKSDSDTEAGAQKIIEHFKQQEEQLKQLLGEEKFSKYQEYAKTIDDRILINEFRRELENTGAPLRDSQAEALMKVMFEESAKAPNFDDDEAAAMQNLAKDMSASLSDDAISKIFQSRREADQRVVNRAGSFLSADQLKALASFYEKQITPLESSMKIQQELRNFGKKLQKLQ